MNINELDSFKLSDAVKFHNRLNPKIWGRDEQLLPEVREKLLAIADNFREFLGVGDLDVPLQKIDRLANILERQLPVFLDGASLNVENILTTNTSLQNRRHTLNYRYVGNSVVVFFSKLLTKFVQTLAQVEGLGPRLRDHKVDNVQHFARVVNPLKNLAGRLDRLFEHLNY